MKVRRLILAEKMKVGDWMVRHLHNERVVGVEFTRDGGIKVSHDYGNGGEPATSFFNRGERIVVI